MKKIVFACTVLALASTHALAKDEVYLDDKFDIEANSTVHIEVPVGSLEIETHNSNEVVVDIRVKQKDDGWFSSGDLEDVSLEKDIDGDRVHLEVDVEDTAQEWRVILPKSANIRIQMGVGEVEIEEASRDVLVDLGVGEVDVELEGDDYRKINLETGVGGADLDGFKGIERDRTIVSESIYWQGKGEYHIDIEVGVGDVDVHQ